jgi:ABC-type multidrug transport system permease subunit
LQGISLKNYRLLAALLRLVFIAKISIIQLFNFFIQKMDIKAFKEVFDPKLDAYIDQKISQAQTLLDNNDLNSYLQYVKPFVFSGGKRIRPYCLRLLYK